MIMSTVTMSEFCIAAVNRASISLPYTGILQHFYSHGCALTIFHRHCCERKYALSYGKVFVTKNSSRIFEKTFSLNVL